MYKHFLKRRQQKLLASLQRKGGGGNNQLWNIAALVPRSSPNGCCRTGKATFKIIFFVSHFLGSCTLLFCFHTVMFGSVAACIPFHKRFWRAVEQ
jgi:hypothetical protein